MLKNFMLAISAIAVALTVWLAAGRSAAAEPAKQDFEGKVLLVYFKGRTADHAYTLQDVTLGELHGKKVLQGVHVDTGSEENWLKGRKTSIDWDAVESLIYYDSAEDYKKAMAEFGDESL